MKVMSAHLDLPPCPMCGGELSLVMKLRATNACLAGTWPKVGVREWPYLVCDSCEFSEAGVVT